MDTGKLTTSDYLIGGGALIYLVAMVLPWYGIGGYAENGLDYFVTGIVPLLLLAVVISIVVLEEHTQVDLPVITAPWRLVELATAGVAVLLVLLRLVFGASASRISGSGSVVDVQLARQYGLFLAVLAAFTVVGGLVLKVLEDGGFNTLRPGADRGFYPPNPGT